MKRRLLLMLAMLLTASLILSGCARRPPEKMTWKLNTPESGTVGFIAMSAIASLVTKTYPQYLEVIPTAVTAGGATATVKAWDNGEVHSAYDTLQQLWQVAVGTGPFDPKEYQFKRANEFWQVMWMYPLAYFGLIRAEDADRIKSWGDFKGLPVFPTPSTYASHEVFRAVFGPAGLKILDTMDLKLIKVEAAADDLKGGAMDVCWSYCDPGALVKWGTDVDVKAGIVVVPPTSKELEIALAAGPWVVPFEVVPAKLFSSSLAKAAKPFVTVAMPFGINAGADVSDESVYYFVKAVFEKAEQLEKVTPTFTGFAESGLKFNIECFKKQSMSPTSAPIHPGVARYLKEKGYDVKALGILVGKR